MRLIHHTIIVIRIWNPIRMTDDINTDIDIHVRMIIDRIIDHHTHVEYE